MGDVIQLRPVSSNLADAICRGCQHEWEAAEEDGVDDIQCPSCSTMKGTFKWVYGPGEGQAGYQCACGCSDYFIMKRSMEAQPAVFCRNCGDEANGWFE